MSAPFNVNERVLCFHGPLLYEAKVLQAAYHEDNAPLTGKPGWHYFVHYKGWKQKWDEWVEEGRMLKHGEEGLQQQKDLLKQHNVHKEPASSTAKGGKAGASASAAGPSARGVRKDGTRGTKRGRDEDDLARKPEMKLNMPGSLKHLLVDDWEAITKNNQVVPLPRTPSVVDILERWKDDVLAKPKDHSSLKDPALLLPTVVAGLQVYFDRALGANLLYRSERLQYSNIRKEFVTGPTVKIGQERDMSTIYGAEHLVRLLVSMPAVISHSNMDTESTYLVRDYVNDLLAWLSQEKEQLFLKEYQTPNPQYTNMSRT